MTDNFYIEPIVGYRVWRVHDLYPAPSYGLRSLSFWESWPMDRALRARVVELPCFGPLDDIGIHAFKEFESIFDFHRLGRHVVRQLVIGTVALWGDVLEHEHGWIAEYAYPVALLDRAESKEWRPIHRQIAEAYRVPFVDSLVPSEPKRRLAGKSLMGQYLSGEFDEKEPNARADH